MGDKNPKKQKKKKSVKKVIVQPVIAPEKATGQKRINVSDRV